MPSVVYCITMCKYHCNMSKSCNFVILCILNDNNFSHEMMFLLDLIAIMK